MTRLLVLGISGATWQVIDPMLARGRMRNLRNLIDGGCRGVLASSRARGDKHFRPQTAWPTLASGVEPEHHGATKFFHTADDIVVPMIWDRVEAAGGRVGVFGWPITWPPHRVNGFLVPGYDGRDTATWPPELAYVRTLDRRQEAARGGRDVLSSLPLAESIGTLRKLWKGGVNPATAVALVGAAIDAKVLAPVELRPLLLRTARLRISIDMFLALCQKHAPQFAGFVTFLADYASHRFWLFREPQRFPDAPAQISPRLHFAVENAYEAVDRALGRMIQWFGPQTVIGVVSEHGMAPEERSAEIGRWHYLLRPNRLREFVGLPETVLANPIARWIAFRPPPQMLVDVARRLRAVSNNDRQQPLFNVYEHRDEVIVKLSLSRSDESDSTDLESMRIRFGDRVTRFGEIAQRFGHRRSAMHAEDGILVLHGPGIRRGAQIGRARLIDVAPTLLKAAGIGIDGGFDGQPLEVFQAQSDSTVASASASDS